MDETEKQQYDGVYRSVELGKAIKALGPRLKAGEPVAAVSSVGKERVLYRFEAGVGGNTPIALTILNGTLYGMTVGGTYGYGTVFSLTTSGVERVLYNFQGGSDGQTPGSRYAWKGKLYGITAGGTYGEGTVFKMTTTGQKRVLRFP